MSSSCKGRFHRTAQIVQNSKSLIINTHGTKIFKTVEIDIGEKKIISSEYFLYLKKKKRRDKLYYSIKW